MRDSPEREPHDSAAARSRYRVRGTGWTVHGDVRCPLPGAVVRPEPIAGGVVAGIGDVTLRITDTRLAERHRARRDPRPGRLPRTAPGGAAPPARKGAGRRVTPDRLPLRSGPPAARRARGTTRRGRRPARASPPP
ncbi:hypothetical protein SCOCK_270102 [Actinacidiphila cocklensis]|uniref:Uncharacterized protein n=1 Tax=Actinacidiphila cocklensis TaxID=887465 RepID=A0A9W4E7E3_9ACTN|nr:hypothetical protein SCOCK_270102 [Actinacidiphila cocklensis]